MVIINNVIWFKCRVYFFTPWSEQMRPKLEPAQVLRLNAATGRQRRSRHIMLGPQGVPSSTYPRSDPSSSRAWPPLTDTFKAPQNYGPYLLQQDGWAGLLYLQSRYLF